MANTNTPNGDAAGRYGTIHSSERKLVGLNTGADMLDLSRSKTHQLVQEGELRAIRVGRRLLIVVSSIDEFIDRQERAAS